MNLRERVENNLAIWSLGMAVGGFAAGIAAYKGILEIAQLEVISRSKLEELQERSSQNRDASEQGKDAGGLTQGSVGQDEASARPESKPDNVKFSTQFPPFPEHLDIIRPGMKLSEAKAVLPNGELSYGFYSVGIDSGPFESVVYYPNSEGEDPEINFIIFRIRDDAKRAVTAATLREYGEITHKTEALGSRIVWPNLKGYKLVIADEGYNISPASDSK